MNRRTALRNAILVSAGVAFLPACMQDKKSSILLRNMALNSSDEKLLAALSATILPKTTDFIGAGDLKAHEFVLTMVDDCKSPEEQAKFTKGMRGFDALCDERVGEIFTGCTAAQKKTLLTELEQKQHITAEVAYFYSTVKDYTLQCFTTSKQYMTDVKHYNMVPGANFKGCVPV